VKVKDASMTAEVIESVIQASLCGPLEKFKLVTVVTDNGSNFTSAAEVSFYCLLPFYIFSRMCLAFGFLYLYAT